MRATLTFAVMQVKRGLRDPLSLFFIVLFPLIFLFIFGNIFGNNSEASFKIAIFNESRNNFTNQFVEGLEKNDKTFKISKIDSIDDAKSKIARGELDSFLVFPSDFGEIPDSAVCAENPRDTKCLPNGELQVFYGESSPQAGQTVASILGGMLDQISSEMSGYKAPLTVKQVSNKQKGLSQFDYIFSGLFAFTLMSMGVYMLSMQLPSDKKTGVLRRVRATPFRPSQVLVGTILSTMVQTIISAVVMISVAMIAFKFRINGSWIDLILFSLLSGFMFCGFGAAIGGWARNDNQATVLSQIIAMAMMFLGGAFFPRFIMPEWLQNVTSWIPMTPVSDGVRMIATESASLGAVLPQIGMIAGWGLIVYLIAFRVFRWE